MPTTVYATIPSSVQVCYKAFIEMCEEKGFKISSSDGTNHSAAFKTAYGLVEASFKSFGQETTNLILTGPGRAGYLDDALSSSVVEPLLAKVSVRLEEQAQAVLSGLTAEEVLHLEQPVPADIEELLDDLREGLSAYGRRDSVKKLSALAESNQRIVAALIVARETDKHDSVRTEAAEALSSPAYQAILQWDSEWVSQVIALTKINAVGQLHTQKQTMEVGRLANYAMRGGVGLLIVGGPALVLPLFGYELLWLGFIPTGRPIVGIGLVVLGLTLVVVGYRSK